MIKIRARVRPLKNGLKAAGRRAKSAKPAYVKARPELRRQIRENFRQTRGPDGPWKPRERVTIEAGIAKRTREAQKKGLKRKPKSPPKPLGKLRQFHVFANPDSLRAWSPVTWSRIHQAGGRAGQGAKIPARPFFWVPRDWRRKKLWGHIAKHVLLGYRRKRR